MCGQRLLLLISWFPLSADELREVFYLLITGSTIFRVDLQFRTRSAEFLLHNAITFRPFNKVIRFNVRITLRGVLSTTMTIAQ
jgi:hypothetical protein